MDQWIERRANNFSATIGVIVPPNRDRISLFICNLGPNLMTVSTEPSDVANGTGVPIPVNDKLRLQWSLDGNLSKCIWYLTQAGAAQLVYVLEEIYYPGEGETNVT